MAGPDIFLSYNREDLEAVRRFALGFEARGFDVWWDQSLQSGEAYDVVTEQALETAKAVVVLWSPRSAVSRWVRSEATIADRNGALMPVTIEACKRPVMFELTQTADLSHWKGEADDAAWLAFADAVGRKVGKQAAGSAAGFAFLPGQRAADVSAAKPSSRLPAWSRRAAIAGAALTGAALVYIGVNRTTTSGPDPRAKDLYDRGQFLFKTGDIGTVRQAIDFYKQAVRIDPDYADAWGALAVGYVHAPQTQATGVNTAAPELARSAAKRALSLDPDQPDAQLALAMPLPHFRRWLEQEKPLRDIVGRNPDYWLGHAELGGLLSDTGLNGQAVEQFQRTLEIDPMLPGYWLRLIFALHNAGREQEADNAFDEAFARWPTNLGLRITRGGLYFDSKRYAEAAAFQRDPRNRNETADNKRLEMRARMADALVSGTGFAEQIDVLRGHLAQDPNPDLTYHVPFLLAFGAVDLAFDALEATYFGGEVAGRRIAPPGANDRRPTSPLFGLMVLSVRDDPRYASILQRTGLEDYWRKSGTQPDFRKG